MTDFKLLTWNMQGNPDAWDRVGELSAQHGIQLALLQEARKPSGSVGTTFPGSGTEWSIDAHVDVKRGVRSVVGLLDEELDAVAVEPVPFSAHRRGEFTASHPGQFSVVDVLRSDNSIALTVVSLYGIWDQDDRFLFAEGTLHRALSDLTILFQDRNRPNIVVAGDLNIYRQWAKADSGAYWSPRYDTVFDRLAAYGLAFRGPEGRAPLDRCPCGQGEQCRHVRTFAFQKKVTNRPYQLDYVFSTDSVEVLSCDVISDASDWTYSDHLPVEVLVRVPD